MEKIIGVKVGEFRTASLYQPGDITCKKGDRVILEVDRGLEYGDIVSDPHAAEPKANEGPQGKIVRLATPQDLSQIIENKKKAREALNLCSKKIEETKLEMQIVQCEYSFDNSKIIFFFTADGRVDFRNLVKDLAKIFKVRIELKQIGVRDKAKIVGGFGVCGRGLCCTSYMNDFQPLTIKMSKEQNLPLNPSRISGICGRIKCCMAYEYLVYREYAKEMPKMGEKINTPQGKGKVIEVNILSRYVRVDVGEGSIVKMVIAKRHDN